MKNQVKKIKGTNHYFTATETTFEVSNDYNLHFTLNKSTGELIESNIEMNEWLKEVLIEIYEVAIKLEGAKAKKSTNNLIDGENVIGKYVSRYLFSDIDIVGKIIGTRGNILIIENLSAKNIADMKFEVGGFSAHCTNSDKQEWIFTPTGNTMELRYSAKSFHKKHRMRITNNPVHQYDYNF